MGLISKYKIFVFYIIVVLTVIFGVTIVFGSSLVFEPKVNFSKLSNNLFLGTKKLTNNAVIFDSNIDLSDYKLKSSCDIESKYSGSYKNKYYFTIFYKGECLKPSFYLEKDGYKIAGMHIRFNVFSRQDLFNFFTDLSTEKLSSSKNILENKIALYRESIDSSFDSLKKKRAYLENRYKLSMINKILENRKQKYIVPVKNGKISSKISKIPNAKRGYREKYTDGIHHGWDVAGKYGEEVIALDYGMIVRIVSGFEFSDLSKLQYDKLNYEVELKNLDILRGNQVWLKTSKGDLVFYSHLSEISNIKEGDFVYRGQALGKIGKSGIPAKNYKDYHLHFPIQKNPYNISKAGKYNFMDYMKWDWYFKGKDLNYVAKNQSSIFSQGELSFKY